MAVRSQIAAALALALLLVSAGRLAEGQPDCASSLTPCADFLPTTTPPSSICCESIKKVVTTQLACLCDLYKKLPALGINVTQAQSLPRRCNLPSDVSACEAVSPTPGNILPKTPRTAGGNDSSDVGRISWIGMPAAMLLLSAIHFSLKL